MSERRGKKLPQYYHTEVLQTQLWKQSDLDNRPKSDTLLSHIFLDMHFSAAAPSWAALKRTAKKPCV